MVYGCWAGLEKVIELSNFFFYQSIDRISGHALFTECEADKYRFVGKQNIFCEQILAHESVLDFAKMCLREVAHLSNFGFYILPGGHSMP